MLLQAKFILHHIIRSILVILKVLQKTKLKESVFLNNPPFPTVEITEKIWRKRDRIFNAADPYEKLEFNNPEIREDADAYLDSIMFNSTFKNELNEYRKTSPNSFWIVDAKEEQTTTPEPYCYIVDIENVIDYIDAPKGLQWVIYKDCKNISEDYPNGRIIGIDSEKYIMKTKYAYVETHFVFLN